MKKAKSNDGNASDTSEKKDKPDEINDEVKKIQKATDESLKK
jgi:hypothetical protein